MPENLIAGKGNEHYVMHCGLKEQYGACGSLLSLLLIRMWTYLFVGMVEQLFLLITFPITSEDFLLWKSVFLSIMEVGKSNHRQEKQLLFFYLINI